MSTGNSIFLLICLFLLVRLQLYEIVCKHFWLISIGDWDYAPKLVEGRILIECVQ